MNNQEKGNSFVSFLLETGSLVFREFTLKSGRVSPYFFNLGQLNTGRELARIGEFYADKIVAEWGDDFDIIFGPAYKGIPLAVSLVSSLYAKHNLVKKYSSNRKDVKTYADASSLLGSDVSEGDKIILVDDVLTTGETKLEAVRLLQALANVDIKGLIVGLDRCEYDTDGQDAMSEFTKATGVPVKSIVTVYDLLQYMDELDPVYGAIKRYLGEYGVVRQTL
ncbi:MAG: Orotate phosphoribosyltransferase [Parcubacteria group bacterium GW2011_GWC2_44_17]|uniref:Orotate phosphoribosyltransferase n=1 Tax=Candidatus Jacksonbacteria bacterium RIFCSPLOWO2_02_FULL_44_20 TaxID=1798460 RepID=A0A1G2A8E6_9BACT|nr:MAG: Orotate phosphoribosyltransferase [Parcubacteria group bacterium GW2011_GWC2_44_17]KKT48625.1 MAG: Orotate phosphoribosyltransferase [Parcubacteria group bacterium GW2011_GWF2_44_17]OGY72330.1 MAG: orotate phosphoribosyltransferase [Candidatus Jacksonbacteria bacterium RIFCSPLOWO2_02_FULL_44_20]OGY72423.1 MAG: orotate phosphoribosyltransferase [Candidatus Jacksonbacteria bacterium RIFCSPHIGHO2_12_FULL_44_12]OGY73698.1 MAG: orotate phosphoribosyltransferase [Candidatus Jacksonbacteria ba